MPLRITISKIGIGWVGQTVHRFALQLHTIMHFGNPYTFKTALFITHNETMFLLQKGYI